MQEIPNSLIPKNKFSSENVVDFLIKTFYAIDGKDIRKMIDQSPIIKNLMPNFIGELIDSEPVVALTGRLT